MTNLRPGEMRSEKVNPGCNNAKHDAWCDGGKKHCQKAPTDQKKYSESSAHTAWLFDPKERLTFDAQIMGWSYYAMLRQRRIEYSDIAKEMGVSRQRVLQMFKEMVRGYSPDKPEPAQRFRLDDAISQITQKRHDKLANHGEHCDSYCAVYVACGMNERVARAKAAGEREVADGTGYS